MKGLFLLAGLAFLVVGHEAIAGQKGFRSAPKPPPPRVEPYHQIFDSTGRPTGPILDGAGRSVPSVPKTPRERQVDELREILKRDPTPAEVDTYLNHERERRAIEREAESKLEAEDALIMESVASSPAIAIAARHEPERGLRVRVSSTRDKPAREFEWRDLESRLRRYELSPTKREQGRRALARLDTALFKYSNKGAVPLRLGVRVLRFDQASRTLKSFRDRTPDATPEWTLQLPMDGDHNSTVLPQLRALLRSTDHVVCDSTVPDILSEAARTVETNIIRGGMASRNVSTAQLVAASAMVERQLDPQRAEVLNALPRVRSGILGLWDAWRMELPLSMRHEWRKFGEEVTMPTEIPSQPASAKAILSSLSEGTRDVLLVVAHNNGTYIYLPTGERVAFAEIKSLKRAVAPERVVVLLTCRGAVSQKGTGSLAETILNNGLATSVFAADDVVDARKIPEILSSLASEKSMHSALRDFGFFPFVEEHR